MPALDRSGIGLPAEFLDDRSGVATTLSELQLVIDERHVATRLWDLGQVQIGAAARVPAIRVRSINRRHVYTKQTEIYQSPACIYKADSI